jgi:hypothetical protein
MTEQVSFCHVVVTPFKILDTIDPKSAFMVRKTMGPKVAFHGSKTSFMIKPSLG